MQGHQDTDRHPSQAHCGVLPPTPVPRSLSRDALVASPARSRSRDLMRGRSPGNQASENRGETQVWREHYYPISKDPYIDTHQE